MRSAGHYLSGALLLTVGCSGQGGAGKSEQRVGLATYFEVPASLTNAFQAPQGFEFDFDLVVVIPTVNGVDLTAVDIPPDSGFELRSVDGLGEPGTDGALPLILHLTVVGDGPTSRFDAVDLKFTVDDRRFRSSYPITLIVCHGALDGGTCNP